MPHFSLLVAVLGFVISMGGAPGPVHAGPTKMHTVTLAVENMTCPTCPYAVRKSLERVEGVIDAKVHFDTATATVRFDPAKVNVDALTKATTNAGYPSKLSGD